MPEPDVTPSNAIALSSAAIGLVSAFAYASVGYEEAKSAYEAARGGSAGLSDYVTVGQAFWDGLPIAVVAAVVAGALAYGVWSAGIWVGAGGLGLAVLGGASQYSPDHLTAYQATLGSGESTTAGLLELWFSVYGPLAGFLAVMAGVGVGAAAGLYARQNQ